MRIGPAANVARLNVNEIITALWSFANAQGLLTDDINERTVEAGVTIDGLQILDAAVRMLGLPLFTTNILVTTVAGDSDGRFAINAAGEMEWGPGDAVRDTNLFRFSLNRLRTDSTMMVGGAFQLDGDCELADRTIILAIGSNDDVDSGIVPVQRMSVAGGTADISGFAGARVGRLLFVYSIVTLNITLQHQSSGSVAANRMILPGAVNLVLSEGDGALLRYDDTLSRWHIIAAAV